MKKHLAAAGIAMATVMGGLALGATTFVPSVASAQEADTDTTTTDDSTAATSDAASTEGCDHGGRGARLEVAAEAIGITADELREALDGGQSMAEVATANGVDPQVVIDALVADAKAHLDEKVADGDLTQEQADERLADATEHITAHVNGEEPDRPEGEGRGPRGPRSADAA